MRDKWRELRFITICYSANSTHRAVLVWKTGPRTIRFKKAIRNRRGIFSPLDGRGPYKGLMREGRVAPALYSALMLLKGPPQGTKCWTHS